jgi:broad specificity phosphatase PhoE
MKLNGDPLVLSPSKHERGAIRAEQGPHLVFVRHGETDGESSVRYHGRNDVPLSALGRAQMRRVAAALDGRRFAAVYASTLSRAVEAARIVGATDAVQRLPGFDEIHFGDWEGLTAEEIRDRYPDHFARWQQHVGEFHYPGGESTAAFRDRVVHTLRAVLAEAPAGDLLFVVHKGVIRSVLAELLQLDEPARQALRVELGSIHVVSRHAGAWRALVLDRTDHL